MRTPPPADAQAAALQALAARLGPAHLRHRLALESADETQVLRKGPLLQFLEHRVARPALLHALLRLVGLRERARRNTLRIELREHDVALQRLPPAFEGVRLLHLSDLHLDVGGGFMAALVERVRGVAHDLCVITGDFRFRTHGPWQPAMEALASLRPHLAPDTFAVLGNHDSIRMLPSIEALGVRVLMNEAACVGRGGQALWIAGIDDPHYFRAHALHKAADAIPDGACALLLSHAPEPYLEAAHCGFDLMLCGHTHGGQLCLPGGIPVMTCSSAPRALARGPWRHGAMRGYTSVGCGSSLLDVRLNCRPEVTVHRLVRRDVGSARC
ncbi:metallophosphoesterase [Azohydromonas aeria]|uniref:metallophosphoesterase n=1 Tax=Azohydromonas aeria TaxID=2590212 RepID=UPI0012F73AD7|nr:metallophosphoesterase [Azohydromonas aeria]